MRLSLMMTACRLSKVLTLPAFLLTSAEAAIRSGTVIKLKVSMILQERLISRRLEALFTMKMIRLGGELINQLMSRQIARVIGFIL